jgi:hypothetical protein
MSTTITVIKANMSASTPGTGDLPIRTDSDARFVFAAEDGVTELFKTNKISQLLFVKDDILPNGDFISDANWEITVGDSRIAFWSPVYKGILGGAKTKQGTASGGIVLYQEVKHISASAADGIFGIGCEFVHPAVGAVMLTTAIYGTPVILNGLAASLTTRMKGVFSGEELTSLSSYDFSTDAEDLEIGEE